MESDTKTAQKHERNGDVHLNEIKNLSWPDNVTVLDLSNRNIVCLDEKVEFPQNLVELNISHNSLEEIPPCLLKLSKVKRLEISYNHIQYFDGTPTFVHSIEQLNISNNRLCAPPYWVWSEAPKKLAQLDISCNPNLTDSLRNGDSAEILQCRTLVTEVRLFKCQIRSHLELLGTFDKAKVLEIGTSDFTRSNSNIIEHIPCKGLDQCCDIQTLNLSNTQLYSIEHNIDIYKQLIEINLSQNYINSLPDEFCNLKKLKICNLSGNCLLYLPEDMVKLAQLECLYLDMNELCTVPENLHELPKLKLLDLYKNCLCEVPKGLEKVSELDLAQNYLDEPETDKYTDGKGRLRLNAEHRFDGRKLEPEQVESIYSSYTTEESEQEHEEDSLITEEQTKLAAELEEEDWDSEEYWAPVGCRTQMSSPAYPTWIYLVKKKIEEGNFCPIDYHVQPVHEKIALERRLKPKVWVEVEGQFDDLSDDDS